MIRGYCFWCGRHKYLMRGPDGREVCGFCVEEDDYINHLHRNARIDRREAKKVVKGHRKPVMVYEAH